MGRRAGRVGDVMTVSPQPRRTGILVAGVLTIAGAAFTLAMGVLSLTAGHGIFSVGIATALFLWAVLVGGVGVWLAGPPEPVVTVGASGLAFGWLAFLLVRGVFNRSVAQLAVAAVLLAIWGGMLWGVLPGQAGISWQGHLFGALGGVLAAWLAGKADRAASRKTAGGAGPVAG